MSLHYIKKDDIILAYNSLPFQKLEDLIAALFTEMNYEQIRQLIETSLLEIYYRDPELLERRVREECINHRLAFYFETLFSNIIHDDMLYVVDLEYNKNLGVNDKAIEINGEIVSIRPDVTIHKRIDNGDNLLAVEAKLHSLTRHDRNKLEGLLLPPFNYDFTAGIIYHPDRSYFVYRVFRLIDGQINMNPFRLPKPTN